MSDTIQVFLRIRPQKRSVQYEVDSTFQHSTISFQSLDRAVKLTSGDINNTQVEWKFRFNGVLDKETSQEQTFNRVAKDCVLRTLDGYNATIFAYGQTGSGKTWSITGGHGAYEERGLLQRSISLIYDEIEKRTDRDWSVRIQFIEVYNGRGYDLLGRKEGLTPSHLGDLQQAVLREDQMGVAKLMNVDTRLAATEDDALNILFEGDSNRVMCATSQNPNSSRSHVVFIMEITSTLPGSSEAQVSKLNIVDLAGSERAFKQDGVNPLQQLNEARAINSSLFFLEQCINALAQRQAYVPYRNSFITNLLKDSIGGNCKTVMLATVNPDPQQLAESISTCKFAQRVATIKQVAKKNIVVDPYVKIKHLKKKIKILKERLAFYENGEDNAQIDENEKAVVFERVKEFVDSPDMEVMDLGGKFSRIQEAFRVMRSIIKREKISIHSQKKYDDESPKLSPKKNSSFAAEINEGTPAEYEKQIKSLQSAISLRDIEIDILVSMITKKQQERQEASIQTSGDSQPEILTSPSKTITEVEKVKPALTKETLLEGVQTQAQIAHEQASPKRVDYRNKRLEEYTKMVGMIDRAQAFEQFRRSYRKNEVIEKCKEQLKDKFAEAKDLGARINAARVDIGSLKGRLIQLRSERAAQGLIDSSENRDEEVTLEEKELIEQIKVRKDQYTVDFENLKEIKKEIQYLNKNLERSRVKLQQDFEKWFQSTDFSSQFMQREEQDNTSSPSYQSSPRSSFAKPVSSFSPKLVSSFSPKYKNQPPRSAWEEASIAQTERLSILSTNPRSSGDGSTFIDKYPPKEVEKRIHSEPYSRILSNSMDDSKNGYSNGSSFRHVNDYDSTTKQVSPTNNAYSGVSSHFSSNIKNPSSDNEDSSSSKGLNPNNPLLKKLATYMKMTENTAKSRNSDTRRSLLSRALHDD